jgi:hypothetical protein
LTVSAIRIRWVTACAAIVVVAACRSAVDLTPAHVEMPLPVGESGIARAGDEPVESPPFGRVIARPELFHGKQISLVGYMSLEFEGNALFHSEEQYRHAQSADAIWIDVDGMKPKPPFAPVG